MLEIPTRSPGPAISALSWLKDSVALSQSELSRSQRAGVADIILNLHRVVQNPLLSPAGNGVFELMSIPGGTRSALGHRDGLIPGDLTVRRFTPHDRSV